MAPRDFCGKLLHNCPLRPRLRERPHVLEVARRQALHLGERPPQILRQRLNDLRAPPFYLTVDAVIRRDEPSEIYRNPFLAQAMVNLNMIDTIGSGIRSMFLRQRKRNFPMPDYELDDPQRVAVRLTGQILDENYTNLLLKRTDLDLLDVIGLDKVQKKRRLDDESFGRLKSKKLIEGRRPNLFVSAKVAAATGDKAAYIRNRAFDRQHYKDMVVAYLEKFGEATRVDIDGLLLDKLSDTLDPKQKKKFITNLLQEMKAEGQILADGTTRWSKWRLCKPVSEESGSD